MNKENLKLKIQNMGNHTFLTLRIFCSILVGTGPTVCIKLPTQC